MRPNRESTIYEKFNVINEVRYYCTIFQEGRKWSLKRQAFPSPSPTDGKTISTFYLTPYNERRKISQLRRILLVRVCKRDFKLKGGGINPFVIHGWREYKTSLSTTTATTPCHDAAEERKELGSHQLHPLKW